MIQGNEQKVFIIDDDDAVRDAMEMLLETEDLPCESYSSANHFLEHYNEAYSGCIVLDIRMPGMSGLELQSKLKSLNSPLPIVFITGHGDVPMAVEAMRQGAIDFMRKPIKEIELLNRIRQALKYESGMSNPSSCHQQI